MAYDVIIVGGGIAGLTAAAYISKSGKKTLLLEKQDKVGGLVNSFEHNGYIFDGGIRATEDLGILFPMIKDLGIDIEFTDNIVSIGVEDKMVRLDGKDSLYEYQAMLCELYPQSVEDIAKIISEIEKIMGYMDIQYGIENPVFKDIKNDRQYLFNTLLPWMVKYISTIGKVNKLFTPVDEFLKQITTNRSLIDIIGQHFFQKTPAYFALSYFTLYLDYKYLVGGTGKLTQALRDFIISNGGEIKLNTEVNYLNASDRVIKDSNENEYSYKKLIWAADMDKLYSVTDTSGISSKSICKKIDVHKELLRGKVGGDSVFTTYYECNLPPEYFENKHGSHVFYTSDKIGQGTINVEGLKKEDGTFMDNSNYIFDCLRRYYKYTTYEIAIPALRDATLAPQGKTGLIVSTLMDYSVVEHLSDIGMYEEFKRFSARQMTNALSESIYPELAQNIDDMFSSTPITIQKTAGTLHGAITGWAFTNSEVPAVSKLTAIAKSVDTPIPDVYQAGQWTFSPSGLPISIVTGKMASDKALKQLK